MPLALQQPETSYTESGIPDVLQDKGGDAQTERPSLQVVTAPVAAGLTGCVCVVSNVNTLQTNDELLLSISRTII
eukprot:3474492-Amphidinium_carterae.1